jgi:hypothetical protein
MGNGFNDATGFYIPVECDHPGRDGVGAWVSAMSEGSANLSCEVLRASAARFWWIVFLATAAKME